MEHFKDKVVLVTGAGVGFGRATALAFARQAAIVAANDLTPVNLDETVDLAQGAGGRIKPYLGDIAKKMPVQMLLESVREDWGRIDILVNAASVRPRRPLLTLDDWDWQRTIDVNLSGAFYLIQSAGRIMQAQGGGILINIGPVQTQDLDSSAYLASKSGLIGLSRAAFAEFKPDHINVHTICPPAKPAPGSPASHPHHQSLVEVVLHLCDPASQPPVGVSLQVEGGIVTYRYQGFQTL